MAETTVDSHPSPLPFGVYIKGDEFKGLVFAKFTGPTAMATAIEKMNKKNAVQGGEGLGKHGSASRSPSSQEIPLRVQEAVGGMEFQQAECACGRGGLGH